MSVTDKEAAALAAQIAADARQAQIRKIADTLSTLCVVEQPTLYVALEALKQATLNLVASMLIMPGLTDDVIIRRVDLAVREGQDLFRLLAALGRDIHTRGPQVAVAELRTNVTVIQQHLPESSTDGDTLN